MKILIRIRNFITNVFGNKKSLESDHTIVNNNMVISPNADITMLKDKEGNTPLHYLAKRIKSDEILLKQKEILMEEITDKPQRIFLYSEDFVITDIVRINNDPNLYIVTSVTQNEIRNKSIVTGLLLDTYIIISDSFSAQRYFIKNNEVNNCVKSFNIDEINNVMCKHGDISTSMLKFLNMHRELDFMFHKSEMKGTFNTLIYLAFSKLIMDKKIDDDVLNKPRFDIDRVRSRYVMDGHVGYIGPLYKNIRSIVSSEIDKMTVDRDVFFKWVEDNIIEIVVY